MKTFANISQKDIKEGLAHMARMAKRPQARCEFVDITQKHYEEMLCMDQGLLMSVLRNLVNYANEDGVNPRVGACKLHMYYNDTFDNNGKCWYEDVYHDYYKIGFQCDYGTIHFYFTAKGELNLDLIHASEPGKGYGTKLINYFLDACEASHVDEVVTYPCYIQEAEWPDQIRKGTAKLRKWMREFGFTDKARTAKMSYAF
jgi:GNAT superfamily N-acetyltransferase